MIEFSFIRKINLLSFYIALDSRRSINWYPNTTSSETKNKEGDFGSLIPSLSGHCLSAGLTIGISEGVSSSTVPNAQHHKLLKEEFKKSFKCGLSKCIRLVSMPNTPIFRARTITSAGMDGIVESKQSQYFRSCNKFKTLHEFNFNKTEMELLNVYFTNETHNVDIASDNFR